MIYRILSDILTFIILWYIIDEVKKLKQNKADRK